MASSVAESVEYQSVLAGNLFLTSSGFLVLGLATSVRMLISNPVNSGRVGMITQFDIFATAPGTAAQLFINPTVNIPTTAKTTMNANIDGNNTQSTLTVKADNGSAMAAGTGVDTKIYVPLGTSFRESLLMPPIIIKPGQALGINIPISVAASVAINARWMEYIGT